MNGEDTRGSATMTDLDALKAALEKATPGEWQINGSHFYGPDPERLLIGQCLYPLGDKSNDIRAIVLAVNTLRQPGALEALALGRRITAGDEALVVAMARLMWRDESSSGDAWDDADERDKDHFCYWARAALAALAAVKEAGK